MRLFCAGPLRIGVVVAEGFRLAGVTGGEFESSGGLAWGEEAMVYVGRWD